MLFAAYRLRTVYQCSGLFAVTMHLIRSFTCKPSHDFTEQSPSTTSPALYCIVPDLAKQHTRLQYWLQWEQQKAVVSAHITQLLSLVMLAFRGTTTQLLFHTGQGIIFTLALTQCAPPYPAWMIDCIFAKPNGHTSLISLPCTPSAPICGHKEGRRASREGPG